MIHHGDCIDVMRGMEPSSVDAVVTDPPYGLSFMGKAWDHGVPGEPFWIEALRVAKPGAHLLAFGGTRTYHRLTCAIEDAGWEIRDCIMWVYGSGFPKSLDVSKAIDKAAGHWRGKAGESVGGNKAMSSPNYERTGKGDAVTAAAAAAAGWGTALKPAWEPIIVARKPVVGTVIQNVQTFGTGAINVDACRVSPTGENLSGGKITRGDGWDRPCNHNAESVAAAKAQSAINTAKAESLGRWPANLIHDGSDEVTGLFPVTTSGAMKREVDAYAGDSNVAFIRGRSGPSNQHGDSGNAARFFYCAKASPSDRTENGMVTNNHPTVKPSALMRYLCRLVTPPNGIVLDPFCGSGSTGKAAVLEGFQFIGIERDADSAATAQARVDAQPRSLLEVPA